MRAIAADMEAFDRLPLGLRATFRTLLHEPPRLLDVEALYLQLADAAGPAEAQQIVAEHAWAAERAGIRAMARRWEERTGRPYPHLAAGATIMRG